MNIMIDPEWTWCLKCPRTQIAERLRPREGSPAAGGEKDGLQFNIIGDPAGSYVRT